MTDVDTRMRDVLLQLALTSNGRTASYDSSGGDALDIPTLGAGDAPHLHYLQRWRQATTDTDRAAILEAAQATLRDILHSRGDRRREESKADRDARIVERGDGIHAREIAIWARCGIRDVWKAREAAGRDPEYGRPLRGPGELTAHQRQAEAARMAERGMSARQIALTLRVSTSTIRRDLGRKQ